MLVENVFFYQYSVPNGTIQYICYFTINFTLIKTFTSKTTLNINRKERKDYRKGRKRLNRKNITEGEMVSTSSWSKGTYLVVIRLGNKQAVKKVVKE